MASHQAQWAAAKAAFFKSGVSNADVTPDFLMDINQGWNLGPALKKFDGAKNFAERMKGMPDLTVAIGNYEKSIAQAVSRSTPKGKKVLQHLYRPT